MASARTVSQRFLLVVVAGMFPLLAACGGNGATPAESTDSGADTTEQDAVGDAFLGDTTRGDAPGLDGSPDAPVEASGADAPFDGTVVVEAGSDATSTDAAPDATADAAPDATADAAPDATADATPDATADAAPDATADATPDAPVLTVLGEPDTKNNLPAEYGLTRAGRVLVVGTKLLVADSYGGRVLVWNTLPTSAGVLPDIVLGQLDLSSDSLNRGFASPTASTLALPAGLWSDGTRLCVADSQNSRVLVWSTFPTQTGQPADFALGQPSGAANLTSATANNGGISGASMNYPMDVWSDGTQLYVADSQNNRVLVWSTLPTAPTAATFALGQPDLGSTGAGSGLGQMVWPQAVQSVGTTLYVADSSNNRVLVWSALPTATTAAGFAIDGAAWTPPGTIQLAGQMTNVGPSLFVTNSGANQVLQWHTAPAAASQSPDLVCGAATTAACSPPSGTTFCDPTGVASDGNRLYVADSQNNRVLGWSAIPTSWPTPADFAIGQPTGAGNLTTNGARLGVVSGGTFNTPLSTFSDGTRLFVADARNSRVLVWSSMPTSDGATADFALGQPAGATNLTSALTGQPVSGSTFTAPQDAFSDGTHLFVVDASRVLVWATLPTSPTAAAAFALGQPSGAQNLTSNAANAGGISGASMSAPSAMWSDGTKVFVADSQNNRVLAWNTMPTAPVAADFALGQPTGTANLTSNGTGTGADQMSNALAVDSDGTRLFVADSGNNRVLIWNSIPTSPVPADVVLGQSAFGQSGSGASQTALNEPVWAHSDGTKLYVADQFNNRVLVWNTIPTTNGAPATGVVGQTDFASAAPNQSSTLGPEGLSAPAMVWTDPTRLFITDTANNRTLIQPKP